MPPVKVKSSRWLDRNIEERPIY